MWIFDNYARFGSLGGIQALCYWGKVSLPGLFFAKHTDLVLENKCF